MLFIITILFIFLIGYLAQSVGLCMIRGVNEWRNGNREFLLAILFSGGFAWVAALFSHLAGIPLQFKIYEASYWFLIGGFLFGLGTVFNQGCGVSTLSKLMRGDTKMLSTILGWLLGWTVMANWQPQLDIMQKMLPEKLTFGLLFIGSVALSIWVYFGDSARKKLWMSMMGIGLLAGFLFLLEPRWTPSGLLHNLSDAIINKKTSYWPSVSRYLLFFGLLLGMLTAAWHTKMFVLKKSKWNDWLFHIFAGTLMGIGGSLALGGNDSQLLLALPTFSPAGAIAIAGILMGMYTGAFIRQAIKLGD